MGSEQKPQGPPCPTCKGTGVVEWEAVRPTHGCGGDDELCARVCPVPERYLEQAPCPDCQGAGRQPLEVQKVEQRGV